MRDESFTVGVGAKQELDSICLKHVRRLQGMTSRCRCLVIVGLKAGGQTEQLTLLVSYYRAETGTRPISFPVESIASRKM